MGEEWAKRERDFLAIAEDIISRLERLEQALRKLEQDAKTAHEQYNASAAPGNGITFEMYLTLVDMEKQHPAHKGRIEAHKDVKPAYWYVTYDGTSAEYPRRSFQSFDAARNYYIRLKRHLGEL